MEQTPAPAGPSSWISTWIDSVTKPGEQTLRTIAQNPAASFGTASLWVFIGGTVSGLIGAILRAILDLAGFQARFPGLGSNLGGAGRGAGSVLVSICLAPVSGVIGLIGFIIAVAIIQGLAKLFHGSGTFAQLAYTFAAFFVPLSLVFSILAPFFFVPVLGVCVGILFILAMIYNLVLEIMAVKAVHGFGWGSAIGSVLILPVLLIVCSCIVIGTLMVMSPSIGNVFSSINQSLGY